jgi:hypothetical protein
VKSKRLALATLFGVLIFVSKIPLVTPLDKAAIVVQALLLPVGYLLMGRFGATYVSAVGGLLTAILRPALLPILHIPNIGVASPTCPYKFSERILFHKALLRLESIF